jgi:hypothetical protein
VSVHGVIVNGVPEVVVGGAAGATGVHDKSALILHESLFLAVCDHVVCIDLLLAPAFRWATKVDFATCFGVHHDPARGALISHGEMEIARLSRDGRIIWRSSGKDIFSGFSLQHDHIEAIDFNGRKYRLAYETGDAI